jgi:hypothetical protein
MDDRCFEALMVIVSVPASSIDSKTGLSTGKDEAREQG